LPKGQAVAAILFLQSVAAILFLKEIPGMSTALMIPFVVVSYFSTSLSSEGRVYLVLQC
jgi:hypothetical protein